jgi:PKD repeat protein
MAVSALRGLSAAGAAALSLLVPAWCAQAASATVYCVTTPAAPPGCTGTTEATFGDALTASAADTVGSDSIVLPAGTQSGPPGPGFHYTGSVPLNIQGQGSASVLTLSGASANPVFTDAGNGPSISVSALTVAIPTGSTAGGLAMGAQATVSNVAVIGASGSSGFGVAVSKGAEISHLRVAVPAGSAPGDPGPAVFEQGPGKTVIQDSLLSDRTGILALGPGTTVVQRSVVAGSSGAAAINATGSAVVASDSLVLASGNGSGLEAFGAGSTIMATQLTIIGDASATGIHAQTTGTGAGASVQLTDSIIADPMANSIALFTAPGTSPASVTTDYSDYDRKTILQGGTFKPGAHDTQATASNATGYVDPHFINPAANNYRLGPSSTLLSVDPTPLGHTPLGSLESSTDLAGLPRISGSGRDMGAYQHEGPSLTASASTKHAKVGQKVSFGARGTTAQSDQTLSYHWHFDDGASASTANTSHAFKLPGSHTATVTVTDSVGYTQSTTLTVLVAGARPVITHLGRHKGVIGFTLNEKASVRLRFTLHGARKGASKTFKIAGHAGRNHFDFASQQPPPGVYSLKATATAFNQKSKPRTLRFTV